MRETHNQPSGTHRQYPQNFQDLVAQTDAILLHASTFFGHLTLPVEVTDGKLSRMPLFPEGHDPLRLLMERSPAHVERDISRTISSLTVKLRAPAGPDAFGACRNQEVTFGEGSYTTSLALDRKIEQNFPDRFFTFEAFKTCPSPNTARVFAVLP